MRQEFAYWDCETASKDPVTCSGLCVSMAVYERDIVTPTSRKYDLKKNALMSKLYDVQLMSPASGEDLKNVAAEALKGKAVGLSIELEKEKDEVTVNEDGFRTAKATSGNSASTGSNGDYEFQVSLSFYNKLI